MADCFDKNLLKYSGTSQLQRTLTALAGSYAQVDERTAADLILLTKKYSAYLNYYDLTNVIAGDWQNIMSKDVAVTIAAVADERIRDFTPFTGYLFDKIKNAATDTDAKNYFKLIFDFVFSLAVNLDAAYKKLPYDVSFTGFLSVAVTSKLAAPFNVLFQYYNAFKAAAPSLIDETSTFTDVQMPVDNITFSQDFQPADLSAQWQTVITAPVISLSGNVSDDINHIITHNLFTGVLQNFTDAVINVVTRTPGYLEDTLENYPSHEPHYALYLSFLRLFRFAQEHLNKYTQRHLDFYYKDVLQLTNNAAQPDFVHLVFELQKNIEQHLLSKGTFFKAGKDANGNDIFYSLTDNLVVHKATVQALKSIYLDKDVSPVALYTSPTVDSEDGQGGELLSADNSWFPFGNPKKILPANIGFAIASNLLYLNEGTRIIALIFECDDVGSITSADLSEIFRVQLTGKKNWYTAEAYIPFVINATSFLLAVVLQGDAPPVVPYSQKIHGGNFSQQLPMMQALITNYKSYQILKQLKIKNITLEVIATVKNLSLQSDDGKINPSKPFKPFGEFPESGSAFIIGSKETFQKPLTALTIKTEWQQAPKAGDIAHTYSLNQGNWSAFGNQVNISNTFINLSNVNTIALSAPDFTANSDYAVTSVDGFIKLEFGNADYSISKYLSQVKAALSSTSVNLIKNGDDVTGFTLNMPVVQEPPAPPVAKSISVTYTAKETISFNENTADSFAKRTNFFYHVEPFGFREMHPFITNDALNFLPVFDLDDGIVKDNGGELWIGLNNAVADETFSLLFQVADGSANPLKNMTQVSWYYLSNSNWLKFDHLAVNDQTNNLTRSGLVVLSIPAAATTINSRADNGLIWIKAVVNHDTDAVCKLIAVRTNGTKAQFVQDMSTSIQFTKALLPNIISKPAIADAALKKAEQPFSSFDGRTKETDGQFYLRVSERLRHKHRAITAWDYERLTLQYFPQIHKAKCINHTGFIINEKTNQQKYSETLPGHVMVVTVPDLTDLINANPLRPYTSIGLLTEMQQYLSGLTSPFVRLHVCNPQFEEIQFDFQVSFYAGYDIVFYTQLLNNEIEQFLTPWAFGNAKDIEFGSTIEKSVALNFIEERSYVDFVTCFKMNHIILREGNIVLDALYDIEEAIASTARSVLVSYYNEETKVKHIINSPANCTC